MLWLGRKLDLKSIKKFQITELIKNYTLNIHDHKRKIWNWYVIVKTEASVGLSGLMAATLRFEKCS